MDQKRKLFPGHWKFFISFLVLVIALPVLGVDVGEGVVEVSLPDVNEELPEPESVLEGDCMNISLKNNDWSWDGDDRQPAEGQTALLVRKLLKRLNNETQRIHADNPNLNLTQFMRVVASRSSLLLLKIKSFARVFGHINALYGYTCRNGRELLRHALQKNVTDDELEEFDEELSEEIEAVVDEVMGEEEGADEAAGEGLTDGGPDGGAGEEKGGSRMPGKHNMTRAVREKNRAAVRLFIREAVIALFLTPRRIQGLEIPLSEYINRLRQYRALSSLDPSESLNVTGEDQNQGRGEVESTEVAVDGEGGVTYGMGEDSDTIIDIFESEEWFDGDDFDNDEDDEEEARRKFTLEGYLFKLMSSYVNKSASCAQRVKRFISERANHLPNATDDEEDFPKLWREYAKLTRHMNVSRRRNSSNEYPRTQGESSGETEMQYGNPLQGDGFIASRIRNITRRLAEGRWRGKGGIDGRFYVALLRMAQEINSWGRAGFLTNGTYFDANCSQAQSRTGGAITACRICPTDAATRNLRMLLSELDDTIAGVYDGIKEGVDSLSKGTPKDLITVYRLPALTLDETMFTLSDEDECTPFVLTFRIPQLEKGDDQTGSPAEEDDETKEVISYEDFSAFRENISLPEFPFLLGKQGSKLLQGVTENLRIVGATFETDRRLDIGGQFCKMGSTLLQLCLTVDGRTRIRTNDAPTGKCHNLTVYVQAPAVTGARLSDEVDAINIFFSKTVNIKGLRNCSAIFDNSTVNRFGERAKCTWKNGKNLIVHLGSDADITAGSDITLRSDRIMAARSKYSHTASGTVAVLAPNNPTPPVARIYGKENVSPCGKFTLSAGQKSWAGRSRGLTYLWELLTPSENVHPRIQEILQNATSSNKNKLEVATSLLDGGIAYTWQLTVRNTMGLQNSTTFTMRKADSQEPTLEIRSVRVPEDNVVYINSSFSFVAELSFKRVPGCPKLDASSATYQWSLSGAEREEGDLRRRSLRFPPRSLEGGKTITAEVTVSYGSTENPKTLSSSVTFNTASTPLIARIKGPDIRTTGVASDSFDLDCSLSKDPNERENPQEGLQYRWECWQETDKMACTQEMTDGAILTIDPSQLVTEKTYIFSCYVGKEEFHEVSDSVKIEVTVGDPPKISLNLHGGKSSYKPGEDVVMRATFTGSDINIGDLTWEDLSGGLDGLGDAEDTEFNDKTQADTVTVTASEAEATASEKPFSVTFRKRKELYTVLLKINDGELLPGGEYHVRLTVVTDSGTGSSEIKFNVQDQVSGCGLEIGGDEQYVDTASDVAYKVFECSYNEERSINYQAFVQLNSEGKVRPIGGTSDESILTVDHEVFDKARRMVKAGETVEINRGVRVCYVDTDVCAIFSKKTTYIKGNFTEDELTAEKEAINELKEEGRSAEGLRKANRAQKAKANQAVEDKRKKRAAPNLDADLLDLQFELLHDAARDGDYNLYPGDVTSMVDATSDVPIWALEQSRARTGLQDLKTVLGSAKDLGDRLTSDTIDGVRQQLEDSKAAFPDTRFISENREILRLLSTCMSKNMVPDERVTSHGDSMSITIVYTLNTDSITVSTGDGDVMFNAGDDIRNKYDASWLDCGCETCFGVLNEYFSYHGSDYVAGESHDSSVFGVQFVNPCTGDPLEVQGLSDPIKMWIRPLSPIENTSRPVCSYLDETTNEWSQDGLRAFTDEMDVRCETNHTTEYVVDLIPENVEPTTNPPEGDDMTTSDDSDDDSDNGIPGKNVLLGLGIGVIVGIIIAAIIVLAAVIILIVVVVKNANKPKMIIEPVVKA